MTANNPSVPLPSPNLREQRKGMVQLHLSVFLAGFTGLFGKLITLNEVDIVWYRMMLATMILLGFKGLTKLGLHWGMCSTGRSREEKQTPSPNLSLREREISSEGRVDGDSNRGAELPSTGFSWKKKVVSKRENRIISSPHGERTGKGERIGLRKILQVAGCGTLLGIHWILFYASIKASNVSIGVVCFATVGFFTALLEPLLHHHRVSLRELVLSLITIAGIACIFSFDARYRLGIGIGLLSSVVYTLYIIKNKDISRNLRNRDVLFWQMAGGLIGISFVIPLYLAVYPSDQPVMVIPTGTNLLLMLCHALFCTVGLYILQIMALKRLSAFTVNLTYNLEPCYAILWAFLFLGEARELNAAFYMGITLVMLSVALTAWVENNKRTIVPSSCKPETSLS